MRTTMKRWLVLLAAASVLVCSGVVSSMAGELEKNVVVYSTHDEATLEMVADAFTKETGVKVDFINLKGALAERVRAEKNNPQSDVMYGAPSSVYMELAAEDLFAQYAPAWADKIDPMFKDKDNYWFGTIQTPVVLCYNSEMMTDADAPGDWSDLADPRYKDQLVFRNALSSSARATFSSLLQQYEKKGELDKGWDYLKAVDANTKRYYGSGSLLFQAIGRKEAAITFSVLNSVIDNRDGNHIPLKVVDAASGSPIIIDGIAVVKNGKHPNAARAFVDFTGSAKVQAMLAKAFNRLPTHPDALAESPEWMAQISVKPMNVDWAALAATQSAWMQQWDSEVKDSAKDKK